MFFSDNEFLVATVTEIPMLHETDFDKPSTVCATKTDDIIPQCSS